MTNFNTLGLPDKLVNNLTHLNFINATPIQAAAIPVALAGNDVMGTAQTGTGKTGAFGIPLIVYLLNNPQGVAVVITPTRELAAQVEDQLRKICGPNIPINTALLIGGAPMWKQNEQLRRSPRLIVGTPGRINDHLERRSLKLKNTGFLVLDETDRMLDMGFGIQIDQILKHMPQERQTLLFSATVPSNIMKLSSKYLKNPERISTGEVNAPAACVKQETLQITEEKKYDQLLLELNQREGSILVFVKTKWGADKMAKKLRILDHRADAIHGDLKQNKRDQVIRSFRNKHSRIMVATDIAARGLDIPHIEHVINYDLPQCPEDYIHRIGRTGRNGAEGEAVNLVAPQDKKKWFAIQRMLNPNEKVDRSNTRDGDHMRKKPSNKKPKNRFGDRRKKSRY
ncbi:MAG: DEAD/DEAH box helicase [Alphaproteobacteria bacterium]|nr:DEAD/DEAH box helicase [Candidatus Jidaibacter sp.]